MTSGNQAKAYRREQEDEDRTKAALYFKQVFNTKGVILMKSHEWR